MPELHFAIPYFNFNFYAFFLCLAVLTGEIYVFCTLKSVPKLGRIFFILLSMMFVMATVMLTVLILHEGLFSASLCGGGAFMLCALLFDIFYNNPKIYKFLDIKKPPKTPPLYFSRKCLIAAPLIYAIAKLGCTYAGCCHGFVYSGPFSLKYNNPQIHGEYFPVQPIETLVFLIIFIFAHKTKNPLATILTCLFAKFTLDFLRFGHEKALISPNQIACLALIVIITIIAIRHKYHKQLKY